MRFQRIAEVTGAVALFVIVVFLSSCTTTSMATNRTGWSDYATIAIKDYTIVGPIRVISEETNERGFLGFVNSHKGSQITYDMLIAEAKKLAADDIINVRVDRKDDAVHTAFDWLVGYSEKWTYTANALAIKYTAAEAGFRADGASGASGMAGQKDNPGLSGISAILNSLFGH